MKKVMIFSKEDTKIIKAIAIILMCYHHLFGFPDRISNDIECIYLLKIWREPLAILIANFGKICVAMFLFLGGYGTYLSCKESKSVSALIFKKIKRIYLNYWKIFFIVIPICALAKVSRVNISIESFLLNLFALDTTYCGEWWFLTPYLGLLFLYPMLERFIRRERTLNCDLFFILLFNIFIVFFYPNIKMQLHGLDASLFFQILEEAGYCMPAFLVGNLFAKYNLLNQIKTKASQSNLSLFLGILLSVVTFKLRSSYNSNNNDFFYAAVYIISLILIFSPSYMNKIKNFLEKIGEESTTIYLIHSVYCYLLIQKIIFFPRYAELIVIWLIFLSYISGKIIRLLYVKANQFEKKLSQIQIG